MCAKYKKVVEHLGIVFVHDCCQDLEVGGVEIFACIDLLQNKKELNKKK